MKAAIITVTCTYFILLVTGGPFIEEDMAFMRSPITEEAVPPKCLTDFDTCKARCFRTTGSCMMTCFENYLDCPDQIDGSGM